MEKATYKNSGVDLDIYAESMARLPGIVKKTFSPRVMRLDGGFAGLFRLNGFSSEGGPSRNYRDPVMVSCTDGVGTKLKLAFMTGRHSTVGIDLVAMSVNDAICCGAEPLFFLDYVAMPKDDPTLLEQIVTGIAAGCRMANSALIGGETAILADLYAPGEYDLAGFCVGVVEKEDVIEGKSATKGDLLIGLASSGFHSNGYSLIRKAVFELAKLSPDDIVPDLRGKSVADLLLEPTRIYVQPILKLLEKFGANRGIHSIAHITGGGLLENLQRVLPAGVTPRFDPKALTAPPLFDWVRRLGNIDDDEMRRVFNMGYGMVLAVPANLADDVIQSLLTDGVESAVIGELA